MMRMMTTIGEVLSSEDGEEKRSRTRKKVCHGWFLLPAMMPHFMSMALRSLVSIRDVGLITDANRIRSSDR
jgi:hypothetical protein